MQTWLSGFLEGYANLVAVLMALTWSLVFFSFQSLILMVVSAVLRSLAIANSNPILTPTPPVHRNRMCVLR